VTTSKKSKLVKRKPSVALLLIDVINDLEFEGANALLEQAVPMARQLAQLKLRVVKEGIPCIYVNDNFGHWKSDFRLIFKHCTGKHVRGAQISRRLRPLASDFFVLKPKHSCVLFTANDAYMRDYQLYVPSDCVASESTEGTQYSLRQIERILKANTQLSAEIDLSALAAKPSEQPRLPERHKLIRK
jgi:nicotinamidase-related amidase